MKAKYIKNRKLTYKGKQYHKGDVLDIVDFGEVPEDWFEVITSVIDKENDIEMIEKVERIEKKAFVDKKKKLYNIMAKNEED